MKNSMLNYTQSISSILCNYRGKLPARFVLTAVELLCDQHDLPGTKHACHKLPSAPA